jgi:hypothetical protein
MLRSVHPYKAVLIMMLVGTSSAQKPTCVCGPDFCSTDPRYPQLLAQKKKAMAAAKYPVYLVELMDLDGACVARVERAPDVFTLKLVQPGGSSRTVPWTDFDEKLARSEVLNGKLKSFYKFNVSRAFSCCEEPNYDKRSDWDPSLELNLKLAIACSKQAGTIVCKRGQ